MIILIAFLFGLAVGSFLNVLILRLPHEQKIGGRSHCPACQHQLAAFDLVPLFSYLFLKGSCRYCQAEISSRYFVIEAVTGLLFGLAAYFIFKDFNLLTGFSL